MRRFTVGCALPPRQRSRSSEHLLIVELERAGLRGYGGAGFPTATKLNAVAARGTRPTVLVNGSEGEPLSSKDVLLISRLPHLVIDGALVAASVLGSDRDRLRARRARAWRRPRRAAGSGRARRRSSIGVHPLSR